MVLTTSDRTVLRVLVVPPAMTEGQGDEALLAASSVAYAHSATSLLDEVGATPDVNPRDHWTDEGGSWQSDDLVGRPTTRRGHLRRRHRSPAGPRWAIACLGPAASLDGFERGTHVPTTRCASRAH